MTQGILIANLVHHQPLLLQRHRQSGCITILCSSSLMYTLCCLLVVQNFHCCPLHRYISVNELKWRIGSLESAAPESPFFVSVYLTLFGCPGSCQSCPGGCREWKANLKRQLGVWTTDQEQVSWSDLSHWFNTFHYLRKIFVCYFFKIFIEYIVTYCYLYYEVDNIQKWLKSDSLPSMSGKYLRKY